MIRWFVPTPAIRIAPLHLAPVFFALLAVAIQSFVVQTHIHSPAAYLHHFSTANPPSGVSPGNSPDGDDPANCPLCQAITLTGSFVTPASVILTSPVVAESNIVVFRAGFAITVLSHSWHGRAPPPV